MNQTLFKFQNNSINVLGSKEKPMFFASQIAKALGYIKPQNSVSVHVWDCNKLLLSSYKSKYPESGHIMDLHPNTTIINEAGLYQLIFASKLDKAKEFQQWVFSDVLPSIRRTGSFQIPKLVNNQFLMLNERNLHEKVVDYIRKYYCDVLFNASLGELQDTSEKEKLLLKWVIVLVWLI